MEHLNTSQEFLTNLEDRKEAARGYLTNLVEEGFEKYEKGEWVALVRSANRAANGEDMEL